MRRCPSLGGEVPFLYCRKADQTGPCRRLPGCWLDRIDIFEYIRRFYTNEEVERYFSHSDTDRLSQILKQLERIESMKEEEKKRKELVDALKKGAPEGKITCSAAFSLAEKFDCPKLDLGRLLNELNIKIIRCQLGCF